MAKIIKVENEKLPFTKFIGKFCEGEMDMPAIWGEWFEKDWFHFADVLGRDETDGSFVGLCIADPKTGYKYGLGALVAESVAAPEGYADMKLPTDSAKVFYIKGKDDPTLYEMEGQCYAQVGAEGMFKDDAGRFFSVERYSCPSFTEPDENGEVILDFCILTK